MDDTTRDLLDDAIDNMMQMYAAEDQLGHILRTADDKLRSEITYYVADVIQMHPLMRPDRQVRLEKIEKYIAHVIGVADWRAQRVELQEFMDELNEFDDYDFFEKCCLDDLNDSHT